MNKQLFDKAVPSEYLYLFLLLLWILLIFWVRPWTGDLRSDPLMYACISKDMVQNHHWLSPTLVGEPYLNKPPLFFWLVALSFKVFGISFYAAKLPSLVISTVDVLLLYFIVFRWFHDHEAAFFAALSFMTTRWIVIAFTSNRPESLLVFSVLLGTYAFTLINEKDSRGPYILGLSFAIALLTKQLFALFIPTVIVIYGVVTRKILQWVRWKHLYFGVTIGLALSLSWFIYYELAHPGYIAHQIYREAMPMVLEGADVNKDPLMYLKEIVFYYHPWLVFFLIGAAILSKRLKNEYLLFVFLAAIVMFLPLQISKGKASRYLTSITPFLAVIVSLGVGHFHKVKKVMKAFSVYAILPLFIIFWTIPVTVNPEKFHVLHLAETIARGETVNYLDTFAFMKGDSGKKNDQVDFVEWSPTASFGEYRWAVFFYLSDYFVHWDNTKLNDWVRNGQRPIILFMRRKNMEQLPADAKWVTIASDKYHVLLSGRK